MYLYQQRKGNSDYEQKSSLISFSLVSAIFISVFFIVNNISEIDRGIYEISSEKRIPASVMKRRIRFSESSAPEKKAAESKKEKGNIAEEYTNPISENNDIVKCDEALPESLETVTGEVCSMDNVITEKEICELSSSSVLKNDIIIAELISLIEDKKRYPASARRRNISGTVEIIVQINCYAEITGYNVEASDSRILENSVNKVMKQIMNSKLGTDLISPFSVKIPVRYVLR